MTTPPSTPSTPSNDKHNSQIDLIGIGNALVDVLANVDEAFITAEQENGMTKGGMMLIDQDRAKAIYDKMPPAVEVSGGSASNTMAGFASLGGNGAFIGKVAKDQLGDVFAHDLTSQGLQFSTTRLDNGLETGRCMILVTPDAERTMNTFLGAAVELHPEDIDESLLSQAQITYLEGYLFDPEHAKNAFRKAGEIIKKHGKKLALTLSDTFCVERHRADFLELINTSVDILFANEAELMALFETDNFDDACNKIQGKCEIVAVTRGAQGSLIITSDDRITIAAVKPAKLIDTTGAGDLFAAGFLFGLTQGKELAQCGNLGAIAASEVISHMGPRPQTSLADLIQQKAA